MWAVDQASHQTRILRSDDGGGSWTVSFSTTVGAESVRSVAFRDREHGDAAGGAFRVSDDGGRSWTPHPREGSEQINVVDVASNAGGRAVAVGTFASNTPHHDVKPGFFFMASGDPWRRVDVADFPFPVLTQMRSVCVSGNGTAVATGFGGINVGRQSFALLSSDGGMTWTSITKRLIDVTPDTPALQGTACVGSSLWIVGENRVTRQPAPPSSTPFIFHSSDGGATWTNASASVPNGLTGGLADVAFVDDASGWTAGFAGSDGDPRPLVLHTQDSGASWTEQSLPGPQHGILELIAFADPRSGIAAGSVAKGTPPLAFVTADGGATWRAIDVPGATRLTSLAIVP